MSLKKVLLPLAVVALAAGVLVGPASASAAMFYDHGAAISGHSETVLYTGPGSFENEAGGVSCENLTVSVTFETNNAKIDSFIAHGCQTTGLLAAFGCVVTEDAHGTNYEAWNVEPKSSEKAVATGVDIDNPVNAECPFADENGNITISGSMNITATKAGSADQLKLSGTLISPTVGEANANATLTSMSTGTIQVE